MSGYLLAVVGALLLAYAVHPFICRARRASRSRPVTSTVDSATVDFAPTGEPPSRNSPAGSGRRDADGNRLLADLRTALVGETDGLELFYQPQVELSTGDVVGVEALFRWRHPERGPINPAELIRLAAPTPMMRMITRRVIDDAIAQSLAWQRQQLRLRISLNVTAQDLETPGFVAHLADRLADSGLPADLLQVELTERTVISDPTLVLDTLTRTAGLGVAISLDDFGTGYSSLQHLRHLPLREIKIDQSFVLGMASNSADQEIVRSMISLGAALGLRVVAEGVEDEQTWRRLAEWGPCVAQGWFFARPMPGAEIPLWLARHPRLPVPRH